MQFLQLLPKCIDSGPVILHFTEAVTNDIGGFWRSPERPITGDENTTPGEAFAP